MFTPLVLVIPSSVNSSAVSFLMPFAPSLDPSANFFNAILSNSKVFFIFFIMSAVVLFESCMSVINPIYTETDYQKTQRLDAEYEKMMFEMMDMVDNTEMKDGCSF